MECQRWDHDQESVESWKGCGGVDVWNNKNKWEIPFGEKKSANIYSLIPDGKKQIGIVSLYSNICISV